MQALGWSVLHRTGSSRSRLIFAVTCAQVWHYFVSTSKDSVYLKASVSMHTSPRNRNVLTTLQVGLVWAADTIQHMCILVTRECRPLYNRMLPDKLRSVRLLRYQLR
jgi:hypothetical protein